VTVTVNGAGVATAVTYNTAQQKATIPGNATTTPNPTRNTPPGRRGHGQNVSGM